jgi:hypothetical protein
MADENTPTKNRDSDRPILQHIRDLVEEEQRLYEHSAPTEPQQERLRHIGVELDQYWDLLRQRRALREFGRDPGEAQMRPPGIVEKYIG